MERSDETPAISKQERQISHSSLSIIHVSKKMQNLLNWYFEMRPNLKALFALTSFILVIRFASNANFSPKNLCLAITIVTN